MSENSNKNRKLVSEITEFAGTVLDVNVRKYFLNGKAIKREVVMSDPVVHVLTIREKSGKIILVREYREGTKKETYGFPAGKIDPRETPAQTARREVKEELAEKGLKVKKMRYFGHGPSSEGIMNEISHFFIATVGEIPEGEERLSPDPEEGITVVETSWANVKKLYDKNMLGVKSRYLVKIFEGELLKKEVEKLQAQIKKLTNKE